VPLLFLCQHLNILFLPYFKKLLFYGIHYSKNACIFHWIVLRFTKPMWKTLFLGGMLHMKRTIAMILLSAVLLTAFAACGTKAVATLVITMPDGSQNIREITTRKETTLGEALRSQGLIVCDESGTIISVEGVEANWNEDQTYWSFEIDGGFVNYGVNDAIITAGKMYELIFTRG